MAPVSLDAIADQKFVDEDQLVTDLLSAYPLSPAARETVEQSAAQLVNSVRARKHEQPLLDAFLKEFGLSNEEGIALMCLAEALLRVPDGKTADELIADKIATGHWAEHQGHADNLFVNASTWALMMTGQVISLDRKLTRNPGSWLQSLTNRVGTPVIRQAMYRAMRIMGAEFVLGRTIDEATKRGKQELGRDACFSFDMLGEGARDGASADRYFTAYSDAIDRVAQQNTDHPESPTSSVSIKLSALHPRYEHSQIDRVVTELFESLRQLCQRAAKRNVAITIDAEEADRLELSLILFEKLARDPSLSHWSGLGLVVQAYGKRALPVLKWLSELAHWTGRRFPVRLVKGAYWDTEIKKSQEQGLSDFPVMSRKENTDLSYLVCAQYMLASTDVFYPQFATHNAHTISAILEIAADHRDFEFQRLHGMGDLLYEVAQQTVKNFPTVRTYAPVGSHEDLLAYLVRRLLENGANSSFVNRFMDAEVPAIQIVQDPAKLVTNQISHRNPKIALPSDLFGGERENSQGIDLHCRKTLHTLEKALINRQELVKAAPIVNGKVIEGTSSPVINPANFNDEPGTIVTASAQDITHAFEVSHIHQQSWDRLGGAPRAKILRKAADLLETRHIELMALMIREAGKTWEDAIDEVREAVDFLRYYACQAEKEFTDPVHLPGPTGEKNMLSLHGRGIFVCISPWNFPLAIFLGQVAAALAAGNAVIAKPAEHTPLIAFKAVNLLHEAGVPTTVLHLIPGDGAVGQHLVEHPATSGVAFTGSTATARSINLSLARKNGPIAPLIAETGGQNIMIVDSTALLEQVTDDVIRSAFASAGQRCSALRALYLQEDIADKALKLIQGAMNELTLGNPADHATDIGPVIDADAQSELFRHINDMKHVSRSVYCSENSSPTEGTFIRPTLIEVDSINVLKKEQFGPILHVIRYKRDELHRHLEEAFSTGFGLTFGIHSRIDGRAETLFENAPVGNTYINRNMVGAVVGVQPFGGQGLSGTGPKAGGPRYLYRFATEKTVSINTAASGGNAELLSL